MAAPRVFLSSTYYDLRQLRNDVGHFITDLGYQIVMHEHSDVPYSHTQPLENDCYTEVTTCDIVVCVIGNAFGSKSSANELSITMNELNKALKERKIIFVFVAKDVWIENRTYLKNKENPKFLPASVDDIKIHQYIAKLNEDIGSEQFIQSFETADEIIATLKSQFAGLFQYLLSRRISATNAENTLELHNEISSLKRTVEENKACQKDFWERFASTVLVRNPLTVCIESAFGFSKSHILLRDVWAVDELAEAIGCDVLSLEGVKIQCAGADQRPVSGRIYRSDSGKQVITITIDAECFNDDGTLRVLNKAKSEALVKFETVNKSDVDVPF